MTFQEKHIVRELCRQYMEIAFSEENSNKEKRWLAHNTLADRKPVVLVESNLFADPLLPPLQCTSPLAREIEHYFNLHLWDQKHVADDKALPRYYELPMQIGWDAFGLDTSREYGMNDSGQTIGYRQKHPIVDIPEDLPKIRPPSYSYSRQYDQQIKADIENVIGDLLPVVLKNTLPVWGCCPSSKVDSLMGMENMMISMMEQPEAMHQLYRLATDRIVECLRWMESGHLLTANNRCDYAGSGSYGFADELPVAGFDGKIRTMDLWGNLNSQETLSISPGMYGDMVFPYYKEIAEAFGLLYYGCCEPVHDIWTPYLSTLKNLRKVSISPWCNEPFMGEVLKNSKVIYCRKPSPNYLGIVPEFDRDAFGKHIKETLDAAKGCYLEFSVRDVYTLGGNIPKIKEAVEIMRQMSEDF